MKKIAVLFNSDIASIKSAIEKSDKFENLRICGLRASEIKAIEDSEPELFAALSDKIKAGKWMPLSGMWKKQDEKISEENLIRNILYSTGYFKEKFGKKYRVFFGSKIYNSSFAEIVYNGRFDGAVVCGEDNAYWLDGGSPARLLILGKKETVDINEIDDDFIAENEFTDFEEVLHEMLSSSLDLEAKKAAPEKDEPKKCEQAAILAEKIAVSNGENSSEKAKEIWMEIFDENCEKAIELSEKLSDGKSLNYNIKIDNADVINTVIKTAEDGSGDRVIRLRETAGTEKTVRLICDEIDMGVRFEIYPYDILTFRIDKDGFVDETFIQE